MRTKPQSFHKCQKRLNQKDFSDSPPYDKLNVALTALQRIITMLREMES